MQARQGEMIDTGKVASISTSRPPGRFVAISGARDFLKDMR